MEKPKEKKKFLSSFVIPTLWKTIHSLMQMSGDSMINEMPKRYSSMEESNPEPLAIGELISKTQFDIKPSPSPLDEELVLEISRSYS
jgi:hypothetical protein